MTEFLKRSSTASPNGFRKYIWSSIRKGRHCRESDDSPSTFRQGRQPNPNINGVQLKLQRWWGFNAPRYRTHEFRHHPLPYPCSKICWGLWVKHTGVRSSANQWQGENWSIEWTWSKTWVVYPAEEIWDYPTMTARQSLTANQAQNRLTDKYHLGILVLDYFIWPFPVQANGNEHGGACMSMTHECSVSACERAAITCLQLFTLAQIISLGIL